MLGVLLQYNTEWNVILTAVDSQASNREIDLPFS